VWFRVELQTSKWHRNNVCVPPGLRWAGLGVAQQHFECIACCNFSKLLRLASPNISFPFPDMPEAVLPISRVRLGVCVCSCSAAEDPLIRNSSWCSVSLLTERQASWAPCIIQRLDAVRPIRGTERNAIFRHNCPVIGESLLAS
jgi:hypothetical protein